MTTEQAVKEFRDYLDGRQEKISDEVMDMAVGELKAQRELNILGYQDEINALREELAKARANSADDFAEFEPTGEFHKCRCTACKTEFSEEMFYDNPDFRFCPACGMPIKEEGCE